MALRKEDVLLLCKFHDRQYRMLCEKMEELHARSQHETPNDFGRVMEKLIKADINRKLDPSTKKEDDELKTTVNEVREELKEVRKEVKDVRDNIEDVREQMKQDVREIVQQGVRDNAKKRAEEKQERRTKKKNKMKEKENARKQYWNNMFTTCKNKVDSIFAWIALFFRYVWMYQRIYCVSAMLLISMFLEVVTNQPVVVVIYLLLICAVHLLMCGIIVTDLRVSWYEIYIAEVLFQLAYSVMVYYNPFNDSISRYTYLSLSLGHIVLIPQVIVYLCEAVMLLLHRCKGYCGPRLCVHCQYRFNVQNLYAVFYK